MSIFYLHGSLAKPHFFKFGIISMIKAFFLVAFFLIKSFYAQLLVGRDIITPIIQNHPFTISYWFMNNSDHALEDVHIIDSLVTKPILQGSTNFNDINFSSAFSSSTSFNTGKTHTDDNKKIWFELKGSSSQILATPFNMKPWEFRKVEISLIPRGESGHINGNLNKPIIIYKLALSSSPIDSNEREKKVIGHSSPDELLNVWSEEEWRRKGSNESVRLHWIVLVLLTGTPILGPLYYYLITK